MRLLPTCWARAAAPPQLSRGAGEVAETRRLLVCFVLVCRIVSPSCPKNSMHISTAHFSHSKH